MKMNILVVVALFSISATACVDDLSDYGFESAPAISDNTYIPANVRAALDDEQRKIIDYFYSGADPESGMCLNTDTDLTTLTTGATGMGVMNIVCGVERGWISRVEGAAHIQKLVRWLDKADRFKGAWAHWYKPTGRTTPFGNQTAAGEIVETAFMMAGLLTACEYFDGTDVVETEIRTMTDKFWKEIEWNGFIKGDMLYWIWHSNLSENEAYELPIVGWNECLIVYILGLAAPDEHKIPVDVYNKCWKGYNYANPARYTYGYNLPVGGNETGAALFLSQYSFLGLDPRQMEDDAAWYWTQNLSHTLINRHYCLYEAPAAHKYNEFNWGLTACGGCGTKQAYLSRDPKCDDGVIAPTAAISAYPYTPFYATQVLMNLKKNWTNLEGKYGFRNSYSPSEKAVCNAYLGMEHAPMGIMIENYRSGLIWNLLMRNEYVKKGLAVAGITVPIYKDGFYLAQIETQTGVYDMMRHPDTEQYQIDFYTKMGGEAQLLIYDSVGERIIEKNINLKNGANVIEFYDDAICAGQPYVLVINSKVGTNYKLKVRLR